MHGSYATVNPDRCEVTITYQSEAATASWDIVSDRDVPAKGRKIPSGAVADIVTFHGALDER